MYYYCEKCREFVREEDTIRDTMIRSICTGELCHRKCKEYVLPCHWYLNGLKYYRKIVKKRCPDIDKLEDLCYNCNIRFYCWTGGF